MIDFIGFCDDVSINQRKGKLMDAFDFATLNRARTALDTMAQGFVGSNQAQQARAFIDLALTLFVHNDRAEGFDALKSHQNPLVSKAAAHSLGDGWMWDQDDARGLAAAYLASISEMSILDQLKKYARVLPRTIRRVLIAADSVGDVVAEGDPKPVRNLNLSLGDVESTKSTAIIVMTQEMAEAGGPELRRLFESELSSAVTRATNLSLLNSLTDSNTQTISSTGDPLSDLRAGLRSAGPSNGYVVSMPAADAADLATRAENRGGMGVRGGTFVRGVEVVAVDDAASMQIIPASRIAIFDEGLSIRSAEHASVDMRDTPESPAEMVNLWQTNSLGLLAERRWHIDSEADVVIIESGS